MKLVDAAALRATLKEREHTVRSVAQLTKALEAMDPTRYRSASHGLVGSLSNGQTKTCNSLRAAAIERVLSVPSGSLFADLDVKCPVDTDRMSA